jgi:hypothetical protein
MCPKGMGCEYPPRFQLPTLLTQGREGVGIPLIAHGLLWGMDGWMDGWSEWRPLDECLWVDEIIALENVTCFSERVVT